MGTWKSLHLWLEKDQFLSSFNWAYTFKLKRIYRTQEREAFKGRIYVYLKNGYRNSEYNVMLLSRDMGMSRSQVFRKCKYLLGKSPVQLLRSYRLEKSMEFFNRGIYNVTEIAYLSGFSSSSYFCKSFKKKYRYLPSRLTA